MSEVTTEQGERWAHFRDGHSEQVPDGEWVKVEAYEEIRRRLDAAERNANTLASGLRQITVAGSASDDPLGRAYTEAGGGYEGLQAVADLTLRMADQGQ